LFHLSDEYHLICLTHSRLVVYAGKYILFMVIEEGVCAAGIALVLELDK
jgi:hypothetical protein